MTAWKIPDSGPLLHANTQETKESPLARLRNRFDEYDIETILPDFEDDDSMYYARRRDNREANRRTSEVERQSLIDKHRKFALKQLENELSRSEKQEWKLIQWQLDQIEDAEIGEALDSWEKAADKQESLSNELERFLNSIKG